MKPKKVTLARILEGRSGYGNLNIIFFWLDQFWANIRIWEQMKYGRIEEFQKQHKQQSKESTADDQVESKEVPERESSNSLPWNEWET